jgi:hypothetical protein
MSYPLAHWHTGRDVEFIYAAGLIFIDVRDQKQFELHTVWFPLANRLRIPVVITCVWLCVRVRIFVCLCRHVCIIFRAFAPHLRARKVYMCVPSMCWMVCRVHFQHEYWSVRGYTSGAYCDWMPPRRTLCITCAITL